MSVSRSVATDHTSAPSTYVAALLGLLVVAGVYADGYAHVNIGGLETFFTPWHAALYGSFAVLTGWIVIMTWRNRRDGRPWRAAIPAGFGWGLIGVAVFGGGGVLDMAWHIAFGVEAGIDALVSPTHLVLLAGGVLLLSSPLRAALSDNGGRSLAWSGVLSTAAVAALAAFFLSYVSVFTDPGAAVPLARMPEGAPGHRAAELPARAGLGGYLVSTLLLVVPVLYLRRVGRLPLGGITALTVAVALPPAILGRLEYAVPLAGAVAGALIVEIAARRARTAALAGLVPGAVWAGQLAGLALMGRLAWPVELWFGVTVLTMLEGLALERLTDPRGALAPSPTATASCDERRQR